jgi:hypothetical protein
MPRAKWYSPQLRRDLVTRLYFRARAEGIPMTRLADRLIDEALARPAIVHDKFTARVAEEPPTTKVRGEWQRPWPPMIDGMPIYVPQ